MKSIKKMKPPIKRGKKKVITHPAIEMITLAKKIYSQTNKVRNNQKIHSKLSHFQQTTLLGAKVLTGHILRRNDVRGIISIGRYIGMPGKELFDDAIMNIHPIIPGDHEASEETINLPLSGVNNVEENAPIDSDFLGLSDSRIDRIIKKKTPDVETFCLLVWNEIRRVRLTSQWMKYFYDFARKLLQGIQITSAQLLGFVDSKGAITLHRYLRSGELDPRVYNALGYYKTKKRRTIR